VDDEHDTTSLGGTDYTNSDGESVNGHDPSRLPIEGIDNREVEEAAFWIPQATPDGRLFYFNTLTGVSTMELPLETPSLNETGPGDRANVYIPESSRPPAEFMAGGYNVEDTDDENSASDIEGHNMTGSHGSLVSLYSVYFGCDLLIYHLLVWKKTSLRRRLTSNVHGLDECRIFRCSVS
jgi:son of sevenless-like protein